MRLSVNFRFRVFAGAFISGCLITWLAVQAIQLYLQASTLGESSSQAYPVRSVTSLFLDISISGLQTIELTGFWSEIFIAALGGFLIGICALSFAALQRLLFRKRLSKALSQSGE